MTKPKYTNRIVRGVSITPDIMDQVKAYSVVENRTFSNMVCTIIERWLNEQKSKNSNKK